MRYYELTLNTNAAQIELNSKIKLKDYAYENSFAAMNSYMTKNMNNDLTFFAYREEETKTFAVFSFDEQKDTLSGVYEHITGILSDCFQIRKIISEPEEITMMQYMDDLNEAVRRDYMVMRYKVVEIANLWIWDYYLKTSCRNICG